MIFSCALIATLRGGIMLVMKVLGSTEREKNLTMALHEYTISTRNVELK